MEQNNGEKRALKIGGSSLKYGVSVQTFINQGAI